MTYDLFPEGMFGVSTAVRAVLRRRGHIFLNINSIVSRYSFTRPLVMTLVQFDTDDLHRGGHIRSYKVKSIFCYNFLQQRATALRVVSLCSAHQDASTDMQLDPFWSQRDPEVT